MKSTLFKESKLYIGATIFLLALVAVLFAFIGPGHAADYGPPPGHGTVTCTGFGFDPDPGVLITATATLDGTAFPPVTEAGNYLHQATWTWSVDELAILNVPGPHDYSIALTWNIGEGTTTVTGTVTCAETPPTTTPPTTTPPTTPPPKTVPVTVPPASSPPAPHVTAVPPSVAAPHASGGTGLPHTGSDAFPLTFLGGLCLSAGVVAVRYGRRFVR